MMKRFCDILLFVTLLVLCDCDDFPVTNVKLSDTTLAMKVGETYQIEVIVEPLASAYANTVSWESSGFRYSLKVVAPNSGSALKPSLTASNPSPAFSSSISLSL